MELFGLVVTTCIRDCTGRHVDMGSLSLTSNSRWHETEKCVPDNKEHRKVVPLIMVEDNISGMDGMTLLQYAHHKKNSIVVDFLNRVLAFN